MTPFYATQEMLETPEFRPVEVRASELEGAIVSNLAPWFSSALAQLRNFEIGGPVVPPPE